MIAPLEARWQRLRKARAAKAGVRSEEYTLADVYAQTGGACHICKRPCGPRHGADWHVEHIIPLSEGGPDTLGNLAPAHPACNRAKGARLTTLPEGPLRRGVVTVLIAAALRHPKINVVATPVTAIRAPHMITYRLELGGGDERVTPTVAAAVQAVLRRVGYDNHPRVVGAAGMLIAEVPLRNPPDVPLSPVRRKGLRIPIGVGPDGRAVEIDLALGHVALAGQTRSGKSTVLRTLAHGLALAGAKLILVDSDQDTWRPFAGCAALQCAIAETDEDIHAAVALAHDTMVARRGQPGPHQWLAILIDEAHGLDAESKDRARLISKHGLKFRVLLCFGTQHPTERAGTSREMTLNCYYRIAGRVGDAAASKTALGKAGLGAEWLRGRGDMIAMLPDPVRIRAALGTADDFGALAQATEVARPAPRVDKPEDVRYRKAPADDRIAYAAELAAQGRRPTGYALNKVFGKAAKRNHEIAADVRAAFGMG